MNCNYNDAQHDTRTALWHRAYCNWFDNREREHDFRAAAWGWLADQLVRFVR